MKLNIEGEKFSTAYVQQLSSHLEIYWSFEELNETNYGKSYSILEKNLGAIKNARFFEQLPDDEKGRKCSISGDRDALFFGNFKYGQKDEFGFPDRFVIPEKTAVLSQPGISINKGEGLSAMNSLKRFWRNSDFPSTADIAMYSFEQRMINNGLAENLKSYQCHYGNKNYGQLLYEENVSEHYFKKHGLKLFLSNANGNPLFLEMKDQLKSLLRKAKSRKINSTSYFAFISFDGDKMGTWLSGENLKNIKDLMSFQIDFSERLSIFSKAAMNFLDVPKGKAVYAGGDDFIGFINLDYLFEVLIWLRSQYRVLVNNPLAEKYSLNQELTFSAGVVISHYKTPLSQVITEAKALEKSVAKDEKKGGRDSLALRIIKHSGERQMSWLKWGENEENVEILKRVIIQLQSNFSNNFIGILADEFFRLGGLSGHQLGTPIVFAEIERTIKQSLLPSKSKEILLPMSEAIESIYDWTHSIKPFIQMLEIADFLKREMYGTDNH